MNNNPKRFSATTVKKILAAFLIIFLAFLAGIGGSYLTLNLNGISVSKGKTTVSKTVYNNTTSTTNAIKTVQNSVVSVLNYQQASSSSSGSIYSQIFGNDDTNSASSSDNDGLTLYSEGSGVIYKKDGDSAYLVTNTHVINGASEIKIQMADGSEVDGELVGADTYSDIAVVKISSKKVTTVADFGDSSKVKVGEDAIAIGSPLGTEYANSVTKGIISSLSRTVTLTSEDGSTISTNAIQTDAAINPGNSGGPLINTEGQVIGITSSKISTTGTSSGESVEGMGFAIPSNDVVTIINQLEKNGKIERPALGVSMVDLSTLSSSAKKQLNLPSDVDKGVVVSSIQTGMPADGKLQQYDVITKLDDKDISSTSELQNALYSHAINDKITVTFYRNGDKKTTEITLSKSSTDLSTSASS